MFVLLRARASERAHIPLAGALPECPQQPGWAEAGPGAGAPWRSAWGWVPSRLSHHCCLPGSVVMGGGVGLGQSGVHDSGGLAARPTPPPRSGGSWEPAKSGCEATLGTVALHMGGGECEQRTRRGEEVMVQMSRTGRVWWWLCAGVRCEQGCSPGSARMLSAWPQSPPVPGDAAQGRTRPRVGCWTQREDTS